MDSEPTRTTLANTPLDLQITICILLHPSDILALRKTCKALELATRKRIVWVTALRRVCLENTLFLPSFPIPDMSNLELERAAMAPCRWIELCRTGTPQDQHSDDIEELNSRMTKIKHEGTVDSIFIVPGGRYLVATGDNCLFVWDLGYASAQGQVVDWKLLSSFELQDILGFCLVQATPDGEGLVILLSSTYSPDRGHLSIFEIYPQSEMPLLTQIAHLDWLAREEDDAHLLPDILICRIFHAGRIVFRVVDYRKNYLACFSVDVDVDVIDYRLNIETFATKTTIIVFSREGILILAIPPLCPQPPDLPNHYLNDNPTRIAPLFKIPFPDGILRTHEILEWKTVPSWYFRSWESLFFDILYKDSELQRFKLTIKPDLSDASLHFINMSKIVTVSDDLIEFLEGTGYRDCQGYRVCEDALVYFWNNIRKSRTCGAYTGLTSAPFTNFVTQWNEYVHYLSLCPASGRFALSYYGNESLDDYSIFVADLFCRAVPA